MLINLKSKILLFAALLFLAVNCLRAQVIEFDTGKIDIPDPSSYVENYEYDSKSDLYYYNIQVGDYDISYPIILTPEEYQELILKEDLKRLA